MIFCDFCLNKSLENNLIKCVNCFINKKKELFFCEICSKLHFEFHNKDGDFLISDVELTTEETKTYKFLYNQENNILMDRSGIF